jgi:hypothetical protein
MDRKVFEALGRLVNVVEYIYEDDDDRENGDPLAEAAAVRKWMQEVPIRD